MGFQLVPKLVTLNNLEQRNGHYFALFRRMCRCTFDHFYVIGPKSYRIPQNNVNYTLTPLLRVIPCEGCD